MEGFNRWRWLDSWARSHVLVGGRRVPAFRACGVAGYYAAVIVVFGATLLARRSLLVTAALAAACAISFFAWAHLRRLIARREEYVMLEHVWAAELACAGVLRALGEPILPYLDVVSIGLCVFVAGGRVGCLLAGCCYGHPSSWGVVYRDEHVRAGFPAGLKGVRLLPVQLIEALGLLAIAAAGVAAIAFTLPGTVFIWFLLAYSVMRFGLESLRADRRPHLLGLSQARWMSLVDVALALGLAEHRRSPFGIGRWFAPPYDRARLGAAALVAATLLIAWLVRLAFDPRRLLGARHLVELRALVEKQLAAASGDALEAARTSAGVSVVASRAGGTIHVSMVMPGGAHRPWLTAELAAHAWPSCEPASAVARPRELLHVLIPDGRAVAESVHELALAIYGRLMLAEQGPLAPPAPPHAEAQTASPPPAAHELPPPPSVSLPWRSW